MGLVCNPPLGFGPSTGVRIAMAVTAFAVALALGWIVLARPLPEVVLPTSTCDLNLGVCSERLPGGGTMHFAVGPRPIAAESPLALDLRVTDLDVSDVVVDFNGTTMTMVPNRSALVPTGPLSFSGEAALSLCISGDMEWRARVEFVRDRTRYVRPFVFKSKTPARRVGPSGETPS